MNETGSVCCGCGLLELLVLLELLELLELLVVWSVGSVGAGVGVMRDEEESGTVSHKGWEACGWKGI